VHWAIRSDWLRKGWLLLASYAFYGAWDWRFLSLIWISTIVDYLVGRRLLVEDRERARRLLLMGSVVVNLGLLGFFKYFGFFVESAQGFLEFLGFNVSPTSLEIILPVGISFYTFQTMSYTVDSYRRKLTPTRNLLDVALFVAFFPQLVAGPIVRASDFLPQLKTPRRFVTVNVRAALVLFLVGFIKKAVIADNAGLIADQLFARPEAYGGLNVFAGVFTYAVQIYGDFSGYSDMAIACGALLGYSLPLNFSFPYLARNITDFWQRWHISLSTWLRDYLYIPLGGNRGSLLFSYRNLMLTMLLGGLWHGAGWQYIIWGGMHGVALVVHREWQRHRPGWHLPRPLGTILSTLLTFYWVSMTYIFFRATSLNDAMTILTRYLFLGSSGRADLSAYKGALTLGGIVVILLILAAVHYLNSRRWLRAWETAPDWAFAMGLGAVIPLVLALVPPASEPFIYFQF
jgi:alginate O-acetyltransferase complex protein AlgI